MSDFTIGVSCLIIGLLLYVVVRKLAHVIIHNKELHHIANGSDSGVHISDSISGNQTGKVVQTKKVTNTTIRNI